MYWSNTWFLFFYFIYNVLMFHQDDFTYEFDYATLNYYNPTYIKSPVVRCVKTNRTYKAISGHLELLREINGNSFKIGVKCDKIVDGIPKIRIVQHDILICDSFRKNSFGVDDMRKFTNFTQCPIKKGFYTYRNVNIISHKLPPGIPAGGYKIDSVMFHKQFVAFNMSFYGSIVYKIKY